MLGCLDYAAFVALFTAVYDGPSSRDDVHRACMYPQHSRKHAKTKPRIDAFLTRLLIGSGQEGRSRASVAG